MDVLEVYIQEQGCRASGKVYLIRKITPATAGGSYTPYVGSSGLTSGYQPAL